MEVAGAALLVADSGIAADCWHPMTMFFVPLVEDGIASFGAHDKVPMSLQELFESMTHRRRSTQPRPEEPGRVILRRLQELRAFSEPKHFETPSAEAPREDNPAASRSARA